MSYTNANSHNFRDTSGYEPQKQTRVKCKFCGCWAKKGGACYQCHRTADGTLIKPPHRKSSSQVEQPESPSQAEIPESYTWMYDQVEAPPHRKEHSVGEEEEPMEAGGASDDDDAEQGKDNTPTKYTNASNHNFRETSPFEPHKQIREKCKFCGCWAKKGRACYQCHRFADGTLGKVPPRKPSIQATAPPPPPVKEVAEEAKHSSHVQRPHPVRAKSKPDNVLQYQFREPAPYDASCKQRMKCPACGCWVTKGKVCTLCKRVTT